MAGSLSGVGAGQQQIPAANTFRPGEQARQQEDRQPAEETAKSPASSEPAESHRARTNNTDVVQAQRKESLRADRSGEAERERGSIINILV